MTKQQHTPGPWSIVGNEHAHTVVSSAIVVADVFCPDDNTVSPESENEALANAHLIAAAPCLLDALERFAKGDYGAESVRITRAALAKARGEQS